MVPNVILITVRSHMNSGGKEVFMVSGKSRLIAGIALLVTQIEQPLLAQTINGGSEGIVPVPASTAVAAPISQDSTPVDASKNVVAQAIPGVPMPPALAQAIPAVPAPPAVAQGTVLQGGIEVDDISNEIAQKELDLMKLSTNLKLEQMPDRWAGRRWTLDNLALTATVATGSYLNGVGRLQFDRNTGGISKFYFARAGWLRLVGSSIIVGGSIFEIGMLAGKQYREFKRGVDPNTMRKYADNLQNSIDELLKKRDAAVAASGTGGSERQAQDAEGQVLHDVRNLGVNEFARWYAQAKGISAATYAGYAIAGGNNVLIGAGAIVGNHFGLSVTGSDAARTRGGGGAGICDTIAGCINMTVPFDTRLVNYIVSHRAHKSIAQQLDLSEPGQLDQLHAHAQQYHALVANLPQSGMHGSVMRDSIFAKQTAIFDQHEALRLGEKKAARHKMLSQLVFFESLGATKLANGILTMRGDFFHTTDGTLRFRDLGAGGIVQGVGYTVGGAELLRNQLWGELQSARLRSQGRGTGQILHKQLDELNALGVKGEVIPPKT
jgi:hypothetical protein